MNKQKQNRTEQRAETQTKTTHHRFADYYNVNTTQPIPILTAHYHISTPKFPSHTVGVPPAGSFVRFKLLSLPQRLLQLPRAWKREPHASHDIRS